MLEKKMKTVSIVVVAGLVLALAPLAHANMIANGSFETNGGNNTTPTSWTHITGGYGALASTGTITPHDGTWVLHAGASYGDGGYFQDVTTTNGTKYELTFYGVGWPKDNGTATQYGLVQVGDPGTDAGDDNSLDDSVDNELVDATFAVARYATVADWTKLTYQFTATGTTTRIALRNVAAGYKENAVNLDSVSLVVVPEPATMSLLALGGLGVLARRRRRR